MRRFTKKNEAFECEHCQRAVPPAKSTCRNHCPFCLHSKHVDVYPGDRANECKGLLEPTGYVQGGKKGLSITFLCRRCGQTSRNKALLDDPIQPDDYSVILALIPPAP